MLLIETHGTQRFRTLEHGTREDGLLVARAETLPPDVLDCKEELLGECTAALRRIVAAVHAEASGRKLFTEPQRWHDPGWIANRLCELLPVPLKAKQMLMALPDAGMRIEIVHRYMRQHHIVQSVPPRPSGHAGPVRPRGSEQAGCRLCQQQLAHRRRHANPIQLVQRDPAPCRCRGLGRAIAIAHGGRRHVDADRPDQQAEMRENVGHSPENTARDGVPCA